MTIWKYCIGPGEQTILMPKGSQVLSAGAQLNDIVVWVAFQEPVPVELRTFYAAMTGEDAGTEGMYFVGTVQFPSGFVVHVFADHR